MSKLIEKKNTVTAKLKNFENQMTSNQKLSPLDELFYRELLQKLNNYDHSLLRNTKNKKADIFKEYTHYAQVYIEYLRIEYDTFKRRYNLTDDFSTFEHKQRGPLLQNGLKVVLEKRKIIEQVFQKEFKRMLPKNQKDEHPKTRAIIRKFVIHAGPTNSGKTYQSIEKLKQSENGLFLAPLRLLALEIYEKLNSDGVPCSLKTGEEEIDIPKSNHIASTIEKADFGGFYDLVVIDEGQMINDKQRGNAWLRAILGIMATEIHICCSLNAVPLLKRIIEDCEDELEIVYHERKTPLIVEQSDFAFPGDVKKGDALIVFSRKDVLNTAAYLNQNGFTSSIIYGNLPPQNRRKQVERFINGETDVVVSTDAIGMGLNLPIQRIVFLRTEKYDGTDDRDLTTQEVKQIAGRAGRMGLYPEGYVASTERIDFISSSIDAKDTPLEKAYIKPLEQTVLQLEFGNLKEKLEYWTLFDYKSPYIEKADISEQLTLIETIPEEMLNDLTEEELYRVIHIPFNCKNPSLVAQWLYYIQELLDRKNEFEKPEIELSSPLSELETLYRKVDLFYSFSKSFRREFDTLWIEESRELISEEIHKKLLKNLHHSIERWTN